MRAALRWLIDPEAILFIATVVLTQGTALERIPLSYVALAPYGAALTGLLVAWRLRRSRLVFAVIVILAAQALVSRWAPVDLIAFQAAAFLVPLNLTAVALLPERGVFTPAGLWQWVAILVQAAIVYIVIDSAARGLAPETLLDVLDADGGTGVTPIGRHALAAFGIGAVLLAGGRWLASLTTGRGYLWALAATLLAFHTGGDAADRAIWVAAALTILAVAAIELSYVLAYHDGLTGLPGRRALDEALGRLGGHYTVAMVDVDHFKQFNDTFGHDVGDQVLRTVATRLRNALGDSQVYRYGGEEFAVLLQGRTLHDSVPLLDAARANVAREPFAVRARVRPRSKPKQPRSTRGRRKRRSR